MKSTKFIDNLNIRDGNIIFDEFDINTKIPLLEQINSLQEDMLQIKYGTRFILDVGWRPEIDPDGYFLILIIQDADWLNPVLEAKCHTLPDLKLVIEMAAKLIRKKQMIKDLPFRDVQYDE